MSSPNHGESSSSQSTTSQLSGLGLDLGLDLSDSLFHATIGEGREDNVATTEQSPNEDGLTEEMLAFHTRNLLAAEQARAAITESAIAAEGIEPDIEMLTSPSTFLPVSAMKTFSHPNDTMKTIPSAQRRDFFSSLANTPELLMELAKHLHIKALVSLYCISRDFNETINGHLSHCMRACAAYMAPDSAKLFIFKFYSPLCMEDPVGRPYHFSPDETRIVPSLRWLQMVVHREKAVRDILAAMARDGHRMKDGMALSLKKMWLVMDISTSSGRVHLMHDRKFFTDIDLYNVQFFIVKLDMRFNDPIDGTGDDALRKLFLGQRGLSPLRALLLRKSFLELSEVVKLGIRYSYSPRPEHRFLPLFGIPPEEVGVGHLEGWGMGRVHLMRPDELVIRESVRRRLNLKSYLMEMMTWGYVNPITGLNIKVSEEEMYMSDDDGERVKNEQGWSDYWLESDGDKNEDEDNKDDDDDDDDGNYFGD